MDSDFDCLYPLYSCYFHGKCMMYCFGQCAWKNFYNLRMCWLHSVSRSTCLHKQRSPVYLLLFLFLKVLLWCWCQYMRSFCDEFRIQMTCSFSSNKHALRFGWKPSRFSSSHSCIQFVLIINSTMARSSHKLDSCQIFIVKRSFRLCNERKTFFTTCYSTCNPF